MVVRFQGGHNAGHTLVIDGVTTSCRCCPRASCGRASCRSSATASWSIRIISVKEIAALRAQGVAVTRDNLRIAENAPLILSVHRELDALRENSASAGTKIGTTDARHRPRLRGQGRPPRHPRDGPCRPLHAATARSSGCWRITTRCAAASACRRSTRRRSATNSPPSPTTCCPTWTAPGRCSKTCAAPASASCSRARRARCSTSTTAPIRSSPRRTPSRATRRTGSGLGPQAARLRAGHRQGLHDARGRAGRSPRELTTTTGKLHRRARPRVRHRHRPHAPLRLVRRGAGAPDGQDLRHRRHRAHQARRARRLRGDQGLHRATSSTAR